MKTQITKLGLWALFALALAVAAVSCEDEPYKYKVADGKPVIYMIRPAGNAQDTLITSSYMEQSLCIVGDNLRSVVEMYFNDVPAVLNNSYMTDHTILVDVPGTIPGEVSNTIYFINSQKDTVKYDFQVLVPGPSLLSMSNEYQLAGEEAVLVGDYFIDDPNVPLTVTFSGNKEAEIKSFTKNSITVVVPDGAEEGPVTISTVYGTVSSVFHYMDNRGILFDFDTDPRRKAHGWHNDHMDLITDETSLSGNYLRIGNGSVTMSELGGWDDANFSFEYWPGDWTDPVSYNDSPLLTDYADFSDWENMSMKFELNIPASNPWSAGAMQIIPAGLDKISGSGAGVDIYGNTCAGANNTFFKLEKEGGLNVPRALYQPWAAQADGMFHTDGKWITVTIPFSTFIYGFDGTESPLSLSEKEFTSLTIFVVGGPEGVECNPIIKLDNIRAVPNK